MQITHFKIDSLSHFTQDRLEHFRNNRLGISRLTDWNTFSTSIFNGEITTLKQTHLETDVLRNFLDANTEYHLLNII